MKVGSIVVVKKLPLDSEEVPTEVKWIPKDDESTPYVIRELKVHHEDGPFAYLEEGVIGINKDGNEVGISTEYLREIQPPQSVSIEALMKDTVTA